MVPVLGIRSREDNSNRAPPPRKKTTPREHQQNRSTRRSRRRRRDDHDADDDEIDAGDDEIDDDDEIDVEEEVEDEVQLHPPTTEDEKNQDHRDLPHLPTASLSVNEDEASDDCLVVRRRRRRKRRPGDRHTTEDEDFASSSSSLRQSNRRILCLQVLLGLLVTIILLVGVYFVVLDQQEKKTKENSSSSTASSSSSITNDELDPNEKEDEETAWNFDFTQLLNTNGNGTYVVTMPTKADNEQSSSSTTTTKNVVNRNPGMSTSNDFAAPSSVPSASGTEGRAATTPAPSRTRSSSTTPPSVEPTTTVASVTPTTHHTSTSSGLTTTGTEEQWTFCVIADVPYDRQELADLPYQLRTQMDGCAFVVHLGDIFIGDTDCTTATPYTTLQTVLLQNSAIPVFLVPGDNEWNDCTRSSIEFGWQHWIHHFVGFEQNWAQWQNASTALTTIPRTQRGPQAAAGVASLHQEGNFYLVHHRTLIIGLNIVGGRVHNATEWSHRLSSQYVWVRQIMLQQLGHGTLPPAAEGVILMAHAHPGPEHDEFFQPFARFLQEELQNAYPVLYLHGDGHTFEYEPQWYGQQSNFLRIQHEGGTQEPILKIRVGPYYTAANTTITNTNTTTHNHGGGLLLRGPIPDDAPTVTTPTTTTRNSVQAVFQYDRQFELL